jgi:hypothetical protein
MTPSADAGSGERSLEHEDRSLELLAHAVLDEMKAINAFRGFGVPDETIAVLADAVASRIEYAFEVWWSPNWVEPGEPHVWEESGAWQARCKDCLEESPMESSEQDARAWSTIHDKTAHPSTQGN